MTRPAKQIRPQPTAPTIACPGCDRPIYYRLTNCGRYACVQQFGHVRLIQESALPRKAA